MTATPDQERQHKRKRQRKRAKLATLQQPREQSTEQSHSASAAPARLPSPSPPAPLPFTSAQAVKKRKREPSAARPTTSAPIPTAPATATTPTATASSTASTAYATSSFATIASTGDSSPHPSTRPYPDASLSHLAWLLHPVSLSTFFSDYWERQPLHIARSNVAYYDRLLAKADIDLAIRLHEQQLQYGTDINLCRCEHGQKVDENPLADDDAEDERKVGAQEDEEGDEDDEEVKEEEDGEEGRDDDDGDGDDSPPSPTYAPVSVSYVQSCISSGSTLQLLQPQRFSSPLLRLLSQLERCFSCLVGSNAYLTPASSQGLALHCDDVDVWVVQVEGSKTWSLHAPLDPLAREHSRDYAPHEVGEETHRIAMQKGDLLYMPRGTIHMAHTRATRQVSTTSSSPPSHSLHVTISTYQRWAWFDFLQVSVRQALQRMWDSDVDVRRGLPIGFLRYVNTAQEQLTLWPTSTAPSITDPPQPQQQQHAALLHAFQQRHNALLQSLLQHVDVAQVGDEMAQDFFLHRLPPLPAHLAGERREGAVGRETGKKGRRQPQGGVGMGEESKQPLAGRVGGDGGSGHQGGGALAEGEEERRWSEWLEAEVEERYGEEQVGEQPSRPQQRVRLLHPDYTHCSLVPAKERLKSQEDDGEGDEEGDEQEQAQSPDDDDSQRGSEVALAAVGRNGRHGGGGRGGNDAADRDGDEEDEDAEEGGDDDEEQDDDDGSAYVLLTHSLHNSPLLHMDSRHPPPSSSSLRLPFTFAQPLLQLIRAAPRFVSIQQLGEAGAELCALLWQMRLLECRPPLGSTLGKAKTQAKPSAQPRQ